MTDLMPWQRATIVYALANTKGVVKTSMVINHIRPGVDSKTVREMLDHMAAIGLLTPGEKKGQVYVWHVTDKGREAVE